MSKYTLKWSFGNAKVSKLDAVSFGLPAGESRTGFVVCFGAGACKNPCYARQGFYTMATVAEPREFNLEQSKGPDFVRHAVADLASIKQSIIRIHDSGDFYSQEYLDKWATVAGFYPHKTFYAYTKSLKLDFSKLPHNFRIVQSMGGKFDTMIDVSRPHSRIFATHEARIAAGYFDGSITDEPAIRGEIKIGLVYHGTKKLTPAQEKYFS